MRLYKELFDVSENNKADAELCTSDCFAQIAQALNTTGFPIFLLLDSQQIGSFTY
jgi:hypothetical protein